MSMSRASHAILQRYVLREVALVWIALTPILVIILLAKRFTKYLAQASAGEIPADAVWQLVALKIPSHLGMILPLTLFLAMLLGLSRMYRDSEMTAYAASGISPVHVLKGVSGLAGLVFLVSGALSLFVAPWAQQETSRIYAKIENEVDFVGLNAGRFNEIGSEKRTLYTEELSGDRMQMRDVFLYDGDGERVTAFRAERGRQIVDNETAARYLVLEDGTRISGVPGQADFQRVSYARHDLRIGTGEEAEARAGIKGESSLSLLQRAARGPEQAELQWRVSLALSAVVLVLLGVPFAKASPRQGRFAVLLPGILIYILYSNLMSVSQSWVAKGKLPFFPGMFWVHALFAGLALALLWRQTRGHWRLRVRSSAMEIKSREVR
jgi:lipopolysaccharide export system permease protein